MSADADGLGPLPDVPPPPFAVFDIFGQPVRDRVHAYALSYACEAQAATRERCAAFVQAQADECKPGSEVQMRLASAAACLRA